MLIKTALLHERLATYCTREAAALLTVRVVPQMMQQTISRLDRRSAFCTQISLLVHVALDVIQQALTVLEGRAAYCTRITLLVHVAIDVTKKALTGFQRRAAQVARQARRGFNTHKNKVRTL